MPVERRRWTSTITNVESDGTLSFDAPPGEGDIAYRISAPEELAGSAGFGFARVLSGSDGDRMVPHFMAVDVVSDNRLLPQAEFVSEHQFQSPCSTPRVSARLIHRPYPLTLARERGWDVNDQVMAEVAR